MLELRAKEKKLYLPEVERFIKTQSNEVKQNFVNQRKEVGKKLHNIEMQELEEILKRLESLKPEYDKAFKDLDREIQSLNNAVKIVSSINAVTRVLAKLLIF